MTATGGWLMGYTRTGSLAHLVDEPATLRSYTGYPIAFCAVILQGHIFEQPDDSPTPLCRHCAKRFHLRLHAPLLKPRIDPI